MTGEVGELGRRAIAHTLFPATGLPRAVGRLGFVQADPIRAPARAQDLILRHRVEGYRAGDLDRAYPQLEVEEDLLYAYGFMPRAVSDRLHPRGDRELGELEQKVLAAIHESGPTHPAALAAQLGGERVVNAWGGYSKATKAALERLHYRGLLRVARRDNGIRVYEPAPPRPAPDPHDQRLARLLVVVADVLAPVAEPTLRTLAALLQRRLTGMPGHREARRVLAGLLERGELQADAFGAVNYLSPVPGTEPADPPDRVRFLAPFDPLVWDRRRFEHLWGWPYRFEAYTPPARRIRGYYALPVLWRDQVVGWANAAVTDRQLRVELGFAGRRPGTAAFKRQANAEAKRLATFLGVESAAVVL